MELKAYEEIIDFPLFYQMKNLIIRMAEKPEKRDKSLFGYQKPEQTMEEQYGLKYPGEVLERYEERCGGDISKLRALALAVAEEKDLFAPFMFTGSQRTDFENKLRSCAETDLYLAGALYLMTDSEGEQNELRDKLIKYECQETPDALFLISILPESNWEYKSGLAACFLGKKRTIKAYGNIRLYAWFLDNYHNEIQKSRCKSIQILKSLLHLSCKYIKERSPAYLRLAENGYSRQELFYMNYLIPMETNLTDSLDKTSITIERMALDSCRELLNAEKIESEKLYELCQYQLENYKIYNVRLEEKFADLEHPEENTDSRVKQQEYLTLFLERAYMSKLPQNMQAQAVEMLFSLLRKKAGQMNALLMASSTYQAYNPEDMIRASCFVYISKSKAGEQYLDSLGGNNCIGNEGSYRRSNFLIEKNFMKLAV